MTEDTKEMGPLTHLRVLDFTQFLAGPYATMILADLGAQVIKLENPAGELTRHLPPHFVGPDSLYYLSVNRNKQSVAIDFKSPKGKDIVRELIATVDIVIENFRPGVMTRLGFDAEQFRKTHPRLIWCSISGFGQDGPARDLPAYDMIVQALSGGMSLTGERNGASVRAGIPLGDLAAGMFAVIGILSALVDRERNGSGRLIDISMLDCQVSMLTYQAAYYLFSGAVPGRQDRGHDSIPTYRSFKGRDGRDVVITANTEGMWKTLCIILGASQLSLDPRFQTNEDRFANRDELWPILEDLFLTHDAADWVEMLQQAGVPAGEVKTLDRVLSDQQVLHREMVVELENRDGRQIYVAGNPVKFDRGMHRRFAFPPSLGFDTVRVLKETLRKGDQEIAELLAQKVVCDK